MKVIPSILVSLLTLTMGCLSSNGKNDSKVPAYANIKVIIDSSAEYFIDNIQFESQDNFRYNLVPIYDTILHQFIYKCDSVNTGNYSLHMISFLNNDVHKNIIVTTDSTFIIKKSELDNFIKLSYKQLPTFKSVNTDTIVVCLILQGCFGGFKEKTIIHREGNKFIVDFFSTRKRRFESDILNIRREYGLEFSSVVDSFQKYCTNLKGFEWCTTSSRIYIRIGKFIYELPDLGCNETKWIGYKKLIEAIDPPFPKNEYGG